MQRKTVRTVSATDARVHFGELLKSLAEGDVLIEKGGIPVAVLSAAPRWGTQEPGPREVPMEAYPAIMNANVGIIAKEPAPRGWARLEAAVSAGWAGLNADEAVANIYRWRDEGGSRSFPLDAEPTEGDDDGAPPLLDRQRRLHRRATPEQYVADGDAPELGT